MKSNIDPFYKWAKKLTTIAPGDHLDQKILSMAALKLIPLKRKSIFSKWLKPGLIIIFSMSFIIIFGLRINKQSAMSLLSMNDSPEMILNYKNIELMADAGNLSEEDWIKIEGKK